MPYIRKTLSVGIKLYQIKIVMKCYHIITLKEHVALDQSSWSLTSVSNRLL